MKFTLNNISTKLLVCTFITLGIACSDVDDIADGAKSGGLLQTTTGALNYVVGNPGPYKIEFIVPDIKEGTSPVKTINLYKRFETHPKHTVIVDGKPTEKVEDFVSNEVLAKTINVTETASHKVSTTFTYTELNEGLQVPKLGGTVGPNPTDDQQLLIGDKWIFRIETILADGTIVNQGYEIPAGVSTRYAGKYKAVDAEYYRIGVLTYTVADWPDETVIESVDATTYRVKEYLGAEAFSGNEYYFQIINGVITYPDKKPNGDAQTGNDQPFITCQSNPADMVDVYCDESNVVINDDVSGKDRLIMSFGYFTPGSGPRTFYQVLEKIVE